MRSDHYKRTNGTTKIPNSLPASPQPFQLHPKPKSIHFQDTLGSYQRKHQASREQHPVPLPPHLIQPLQLPKATIENVYALSGAVPMRFTDLTTHTRRQMRDYLTTWGRHHMQNMGPISLRKLEEFVDELIFDAWTGGDKITEPKMDWPKITEIYVAVGIFKKDLPDPNRARSLFETDYLVELLAYLGLRERYTPHESRKAGKTAYVRARLDKSQDAVILDWLDVHGKWVP